MNIYNKEKKPVYSARISKEIIDTFKSECARMNAPHNYIISEYMKKFIVLNIQLDSHERAVFDKNDFDKKEEDDLINDSEHNKNENFNETKNSEIKPIYNARISKEIIDTFKEVCSKMNIPHSYVVSEYMKIHVVLNINRENYESPLFDKCVKINSDVDINNILED